MNIYNITFPPNYINLDGFNLSPYGNIAKGRLTINNSAKGKILIKKYIEQISKIFSIGSLSKFVKTVDSSYVIKVGITVEPNGKITRLSLSDSQVTDYIDDPSLTAEQLFDIVRMFHLFYCLNTLSYTVYYNNRIIIPCSLQEQQNNIRANLGNIICVPTADHRVEFVLWDNLTSAMRTNVYFDNKKVQSYSFDNNNCSTPSSQTFPIIIVYDQYISLKREVAAVIDAAKIVLGDKTDLSIIRGHFEAHPDGPEGSSAIKQNQFRTRQVRSNSL